MDKRINAKKFIVDTDIGADCDDAVALAYLLSKEKARLCEIKAVTLCTTRQYAPACVKAILSQFGRADVNVGIYKGVPLICDAVDNYSEDIATKYNPDYDNLSTDDAVRLIRKTLAESREKIGIIELGPLCNVNALLKSEPDEFSPLNGIEIVKEKVEKMYLMGCRFFAGDGNDALEAEWNIEQDIDGASFVMQNFPSEIIVCPFETGERVTTYSYSVSGVVYDCMHYYEENRNRRKGLRFDAGVYTRPSWDPLTAMLALSDERMSFKLSNFGYITIDKKGVSTFVEKADGKQRFLHYDRDMVKKAERVLNEFLRSIR